MHRGSKFIDADPGRAGIEGQGKQSTIQRGLAKMNLEGKRLGKYEIQTVLGRGGMGVVYRAYDPTLNRTVAVKVLPAHLTWDKQFVERFLREAQAAAGLNHPNIVTIHDVGEQDGSYYFVMNYV